MVAHGRCIQTDERARNERDSGRCSVWKTKSCVAWSYWVGSKNHFCFSLHRVAWRIHCSGRPLSYWMTGCRLGWDRGQACCGVIPKLSSLGNIFFFLFLPFLVIFFPSHLQRKLTRTPGINGFLMLPPCFHPGPGPWFLTIICKPRGP